MSSDPQYLGLVELLAALCFQFHALGRKWQPTPVFLPGESQGRGSLVGCYLGSHRVGWSDLAAAAVALCLSQHPLDHWYSFFKHVKLLPQVICTCDHIAWMALSSTFQMDSSLSFGSQILLLHRSLLWVPYLTWVHLLFSLSLFVNFMTFNTICNYVISYWFTLFFCCPDLNLSSWSAGTFICFVCY